jgi:transposase
MADGALREPQRKFGKLYAKTGRPSIAPEKLLRALLLQVLYTVRSERMLMEQLNYNLLFRWFVGLNMDDAIWDVTVFTKNRQRLLEGDIAEAFFAAVLKQARSRICSPMSTSLWMEPCCRHGQDRRASGELPR